MADSGAERIAQLRELIEYHDRLYYEHDAPELPDAEYDVLLRELRALEAQHPELIDESSPTATVRGFAPSTFAPVVHAVPMTSLDNAMSADELEAWTQRVLRGLGGVAPRFVAELKFDGLATAASVRTSRPTCARSTTYPTRSPKPRAACQR
jgi:DNA ligase (NAD+)